MSLAQVYGPGKLGLSFELFPPKSAEMEAALWEHVDKLGEFRPSYFTCTYGAGGSTRNKTLEVVRRVKERCHVPVASHLTCVGATVDQLRAYLTEACQVGIDYIVALRGDPPKGEAEFKPVAGGLRYANELVALIRSEFPSLGIAVAGYPETHQEAPNAAADLVNLKRKVDAGADVVITQLFYDNDDYFRFRDQCDQLGIRVPIIPGLLPVTNLAQVQRIASLCKARLPQRLVDALSQRSDAEWQSEVGIEYATEQVRDLLARGVPGVHFYVLNKSQATGRVLEAVGWSR